MSDRAARGAGSSARSVSPTSPTRPRLMFARRPRCDGLVVDLDDRGIGLEERPVREVRSEHQQQVAIGERLLRAAPAEQAGHAHAGGVVVLEHVLAAIGVADRGLQRLPTAAAPRRARHASRRRRRSRCCFAFPISAAARSSASSDRSNPRALGDDSVLQQRDARSSPRRRLREGSPSRHRAPGSPPASRAPRSAASARERRSFRRTRSSARRSAPGAVSWK